MIHTQCAVCETSESDRELYRDTLGKRPPTYEHFSARRTPDRVHYRIVRCARCGLVRSDPVLPDDELAELYAGSTFTYAEESPYTRATYGRYLRECLPLLPRRGRLLEIGCGNGFFLEEAQACGFDVWGVEPSRDAVERAAGALQGRIYNDIFRDGLFPPGHFDIVCAFQVFDHLSYPNEVLRTCWQALRQGGLVLLINHDVGALTNRLLGERSPIVDVEHTYLYDKKTIAHILSKNGFEVVRVFAVENRYPFHYWCKMAPFPASLKQKLLPRLKQSRLGRITIPLKAGNLCAVARRPPDASP